MNRKILSTDTDRFWSVPYDFHAFPFSFILICDTNSCLSIQAVTKLLWEFRKNSGFFQCYVTCWEKSWAYEVTPYSRLEDFFLFISSMALSEEYEEVAKTSWYVLRESSKDCLHRVKFSLVAVVLVLSNNYMFVHNRVMYSLPNFHNHIFLRYFTMNEECKIIKNSFLVIKK